MVNDPTGNTSVEGATPPKVVLPVLCISMFSVIFNLRVLGPILVDISQDFKVSIATAGSLAVAYAVPYAVMALFIGPLSDKYGRRRMMIIGIATLAITALAAMLAPTFSVLLVARGIAGLGGAILQPAVLASVGDYFPYAQRGKAMGWVISATTLSTVLGVPAGTFLAGIFTWRWIFGLLSIILIAATLIIVLIFPEGDTQTQEGSGGWDQYRNSFKRVFQEPSAIATLITTSLFGMFWHGWNTFNGAFYIETFNLSTEDFALYVMFQGIGTFTGSYVGGLISDRITKKTATTLALLIGGLAVSQITTFPVSLWLTVAINILMAFCCGIRFTAGHALATQQVPAARGTMMALNASAIQFGGTVGSSTGSLLISGFNSFTPLGWAYGAFSVLASIVMQFFVKDDPAKVEQ